MAVQYLIGNARKQVIDTMGELCAGRITPEAAMAVLHEHDVLMQRVGK